MKVLSTTWSADWAMETRQHPGCVFGEGDARGNAKDSIKNSEVCRVRAFMCGSESWVWWRGAETEIELHMYYARLSR